MTSSCSSDDIDQEEIQLALQAAKIATREKIRSRFHGSNDLIHRLFVCISGMRITECINYFWWGFLVYFFWFFAHQIVVERIRDEVSGRLFLGPKLQSGLEGPVPCLGLTESEMPEMLTSWTCSVEEFGLVSDLIFSW